MNKSGDIVGKNSLIVMMSLSSELDAAKCWSSKVTFITSTTSRLVLSDFLINACKMWHPVKVPTSWKHLWLPDMDCRLNLIIVLQWVFFWSCFVCLPCLVKVTECTIQWVSNHILEGALSKGLPCMILWLWPSDLPLGVSLPRITLARRIRCVPSA